MGKLFGTDGVRGVANSDLSPLLAYRIGRAAVAVLPKDNNRPPKILIGMDTRLSGPMLMAAFSAGVCSAGGNAVNLGVIPTPAVAYLSRHLKADLGVVISASHNPVEYNGIKIFDSRGFKLKDELEDEIENMVLSPGDNGRFPTGAGVGDITCEENSVECYIDYILSIYPGLDLSDYKIALDCAEGATYNAAPRIFEKLGANVSVIHNKPNGVNINKDCGSTHMEELSAFVKSGSFDLGIAFDGDGDRCLLADENGNLMDGDEIMAVCACYMKDKGSLNNNTLVATVMSNLGLFIMGEENGIHIEKTAVGDKYVLERMVELKASLGGEQSGHVIFLDHNTTGDGILTAVSVLNIMAAEKMSVGKLNNKVKILPQVLVGAKVLDHKKHNFNEVVEINEAITELEKKFHGKGRVLIRASGTEPLVRVMIEGEDKELLKAEAEKMRILIEKHLGKI